MTDTFRKEYKQLSETTKAFIVDIKDTAEELHSLFNSDLCADKRMAALAKTNLEQAVMWTIKSIT